MEETVITRLLSFYSGCHFASWLQRLSHHAAPVMLVPWDARNGQVDNDDDEDEEDEDGWGGGGDGDEDGG